MSLPVVLLLAALTGYLSLSHELLWVKVISNGWANRPTVFGNVLAVFLLGVAIGSLAAPRLLRRVRWHPSRVVGALTAASGFVFFGSIMLGAQAMTVSAPLGRTIMLAGVATVAALMGSAFPALCAMGAPSGADVGRRVSWIYLANIAGSTAGPLLTGFVLLDLDTLQHNILIIAVMTVVVGQVTWMLAPADTRSGRSTAALPLATALLLAAMLASANTVSDGLLEKLHFHSAQPADRYKYVEQGRAGIAGVTQADALYGEGLYDGRYNLDAKSDVNLIRRAYLVPALHRAPRRVLEVGLGSGSWARVMANYPGVDSLTVVEINPVYLKLLWHFPAEATLLRDPKVAIHIADARQWLARNPTRRFDMIVINGTWHWRANATHLLSAEFLQFTKRFLAPGGVVYWNTTGSDDAYYTAAGVFAHVVRYSNFVAGSDAPFDMTVDERLAALRRFPGADSVLDALARVDLPDLAHDLRQAGDVWYVTENNMATEFKTNGSGAWWRGLGERVFRPDRAWLRVLFR